VCFILGANTSDKCSSLLQQGINFAGKKSFIAKDPDGSKERPKRQKKKKLEQQKDIAHMCGFTSFGRLTFGRPTFGRRSVSSTTRLKIAVI